MTAIVCVASILGATIFPSDAVPPIATAGPLQGNFASATSLEPVPFSFGPYHYDGVDAFERALSALEAPPVLEMPGKPSPDAEPIPYQPTPEQPDGPAIPLPRNYTPPPRPVVDSNWVRDEALDEFRALGAAQWQIDVFDCIGYKESGWQSKRSNRPNANGTWDHGPFQINDVHWPTLNRLGLDPYNARDAARYAWRLSGNGSFFTAWSVHWSCGV
jgi:hypothetical protein